MNNQQWLPMESAPTDELVLACGYTIEFYSKLRKNFEFRIIDKPGWSNDWLAENGEVFEPLGWLPIPECPQLEGEIEQKAPNGSPKYAVGDVVEYYTRYDGLQPVTISKVIVWPSGFWYGLAEIQNPGHGNPRLGSEQLDYDFASGEIWRRPISEKELDYRPGIE